MGLFWSLLKGCFGVSALPCGAQRGGAEERMRRRIAQRFGGEVAKRRRAKRDARKGPRVLRKGASRQGRSSTALRVRVCFKPRSSSPAQLRASALKTTIPRQIASILCVIRYKSRVRFQQTPEEPKILRAFLERSWTILENRLNPSEHSRTTRINSLSAHGA